MKLYIDNHSFHYEFENLLRLFLPNERIEVLHAVPDDNKDENHLYTAVKSSESQTTMSISILYDERRLSVNKPAHKGDNIELCMARMIYKALSRITGRTPPWGVLTGVRPIKLINSLMNEIGKEEAYRYFTKELLVSKQKAALALQTGENQMSIINSSDKNSFSLYISIPFCKTRCSYCSFVSQSIESAFELIPNYVNLLCEEIRYAGRIVKDIGLRLQTVYIGGGTPTILNPRQLDSVMEAINLSFDMRGCKEFTVEAGRPDTITDEKLAVIKTKGCTRISINPQTMNDDLLEKIGRKHTSDETVKAYSLARHLGFCNINMDLIAGLPGDSLKSFGDTLNRIIILSPENVTVHTLAMKRSSRLNQNGMFYLRNEEIKAQKMLEYAQKTLMLNGFFPYYLYRQSKIIGNLENTAFSKKGYEGIYNIFVMDETHSIISCGAGGVTKLKDPYSRRLLRVNNYKFPHEYINNFNQVLLRKDRVKSYYDKIQK